MEDRILHGGLHAKQGKTGGLQVEVMPVQPKGQPMEREKLQVKAQPPLVVRDVFHDEPRVDDIAVIRVHARCAAGHGVGIIHPPIEPERLEVLSELDVFRQREPPEFGARKAPQGREPAGDAFGVEPLTAREGHSVVERERGAPSVRVLHEAAIFEINRGVPRPSIE
jgi:hypothetical protein